MNQSQHGSLAQTEYTTQVQIQNYQEGSNKKDLYNEKLVKQTFQEQKMQDEDETKQDSNSHESQEMDQTIAGTILKTRLNQELDFNNKQIDLTAENALIRERIEQIRNQMTLIQSGNGQDLIDYFYNTYKLISNEIIDFEQLKNSPDLKIKKYKQGAYYFGEMLNDQKFGKGIMVYSSGRVYEGEWQNDKKFGKGLEIDSNGNRYEGDFVNGKCEGQGTFIWQNGEVYDGQWLQGMKHGSGMWRGANGDSYLGEWKQDKADGYGLHTWARGDRYEGLFKNGLKHGEGAEKFANGDRYTGSYVNGRPEGLGEYIFSNKSCYKGPFKNGLRHGRGVWKRRLDQNADKYEGEFKNDQKSGYGVFTWETGNYYKGHFFNNLRHGYGEMYWTDGSYYKGMWEKGIQNGEGELVIPGEEPRKGIFLNNKLQRDLDPGENSVISEGNHHHSQGAENNQDELIDAEEEEEAERRRGPAQKKRPLGRSQESSNYSGSKQPGSSGKKFARESQQELEEDQFPIQDGDEDGQSGGMRIQQKRFKQPDMSSTDQLPLVRPMFNPQSSKKSSKPPPPNESHPLKQKLDSRESGGDRAKRNSNNSSSNLSLQKILERNQKTGEQPGSHYDVRVPQKKIKRNISSTSESQLENDGAARAYRSQSHNQSPVPYIRTFSKNTRSRRQMTELDNQSQDAQGRMNLQPPNTYYDEEDDVSSLEKNFQKNFNHYSKSVRARDTRMFQEHHLPSLRVNGGGKKTSPEISEHGNLNILKRSISVSGERFREQEGVQMENKGVQAQLGLVYNPFRLSSNKKKKTSPQRDNSNSTGLPTIKKRPGKNTGNVNYIPLRGRLQKKGPGSIQGLLAKHEYILWKKYCERFPIKKGVYDDLYDPITVNSIRKLIHPPIWKPNGPICEYTPPKNVTQTHTPKKKTDQQVSKFLYVPKLRIN